MANTDSINTPLDIISFNMHGFNQGCETVKELIDDNNPDVFLFQEHWLTPANLCKFDIFSDYFMFGSSAMSTVIESGVLVGRPFGGVAMLIKNTLRNETRTIHCSERYAVIKIRNYVIISLYLPCIGTDNRLLICQDLLDEMWSLREQYDNCECIIAGDFNVDLDTSDNIACLINSFRIKNSLVRCDDLFLRAKTPTYVNNSLNHKSCIDYMLVSSSLQVTNYDVIDPEINYSDHLPIIGSFISKATISEESSKCNRERVPPVQLRWDHADLIGYYNFTRCNLEPILARAIEVTSQFNNIDNRPTTNNNYDTLINQLHDDTIAVLTTGAQHYVPHQRKNFYKFWWDQEMEILKAASIESNQVWKASGKPRHGPIFNKRQTCRLQYRKKIRENQALVVSSYSNDLHDALLKKNGTNFWKCWNSKFECNYKCNEVEGCVDVDIIANKFADHFSAAYTATDINRANSLYTEYVTLRANYVGFPLPSSNMFDAELLGNVIDNLSRGKAGGLDGITAEHLQHCHPIISSVLLRLFNLMLSCHYVPAGFCHSYTVPLPKVKNCRSKAMTCNDFRGIAISSAVSKVFELCILDKFKSYFSTEDNQFGFKKGLGCTHAIYTVQNIVNKFVKDGSTVNICALDLTKAFDKTNHHALFIKLMKRYIPVDLLDTLEYWLSNNWSCIKWFNTFSPAFKICLGVRQGSVLSPYLFAVYLDELADRRSNGRFSYIILYADDILLVSSSLCELQILLHACERELKWLDMAINVNKSCCIRIGPRFGVKCIAISTINGDTLPWVTELRYLGIYLIHSRVFCCSHDQAKRAYHRSLNAIFGKVGRIASEEVVLQLVSSKCLPILMYGTEACGLKKSDIRSLDFTVNRFLMKLFKTGNISVIQDCTFFFNFMLPSTLLVNRTKIFLRKYNNCENFLCKLFPTKEQ
jgi:exonuclease III